MISDIKSISLLLFASSLRSGSMLGSLPVKHEKSSMDKFFSYSDSIIRFYFMCQNHRKIKFDKNITVQYWSRCDSYQWFYSLDQVWIHLLSGYGRILVPSISPRHKRSNIYAIFIIYAFDRIMICSVWVTVYNQCSTEDSGHRLLSCRGSNHCSIP